MIPLCTCGHGKFAGHPWTGSRYGACQHCSVCGRLGRLHDGISHPFTRCTCNRYEAAA